MIDWIIQQQGVLSLCLVLLIATERFLTANIDEKFAYRLWLLVPFVLLCNNVPENLASAPAAGISHYVVSMNPGSVELESDWLLTAWLIGVLAISAFVVIRYTQLYRSLGRQDKVSTTICHTSQRVSSPIVLGVTSPRILIPADFRQVFCEQQQAMVIEHEGIHIRHGDHLWNALALVFMTLFWFNPLVWIAAHSFRNSQEHACDAKALKNKSKQQKILYAKALLKCAEQRSWEQSLLPAMSDKNTLVKRLALIKQPAKANRYVRGCVILIAVAFSVNTLLACSPETQQGRVLINDINPSKRVEPLYPQSASDNGQEGSVILRFDITASGNTDNIEIVQSFPAGVFDQSAKEALAQWEYKSQEQNGSGGAVKGAFVQLDYRLYPR